MPNIPTIESGIIDFPPEFHMFASGDKKVINWEGENYYLACGAFVADLALGVQSSCVKRVDHPNIRHEDYDGNQKTREPGDEAVDIRKAMENG